MTGGGLNRPPFLFLDDERLTKPEPTGHELPAHEKAGAHHDAAIAAAVAPASAAMGYELVRVAVHGGSRPTVEVMIDRADGEPVTIDNCEAISRDLGALLDVEDPLPGAWALEISSPGIDRPLTRVKDWNRFAGHLASAETAAPIAGRRRFSGIVLGANELAARLRLDDGTEVALPLAELRRAKLVLTDALIAAARPTRTN